MSRPRVVILIEDGGVTGIVSDCEEVDVIIQDFDTEDGDHGGLLPTNAIGQEFNPITGPDEIDPEYVERTFRQVKDVYG